MSFSLSLAPAVPIAPGHGLSAPCKQRTTRAKNTSTPKPSLAPSSSTPNLQLLHDMDFEDPDPRDTPYSLGEALTHSSSITPPPKILFPTKKKRAVSNDSDSEIEKPRKKKKAAAVLGPEDRKLVLMIPRAELDSSQRVLLTHSTLSQEALDLIHETIGCADIAVKPVLTYKLRCLKSVTAAEKLSKPISVKINVTEQKIQIMDLEHAESRDDDFDNGLSIMDKEKKHLRELQGKYSRCQLCGPDKACHPGRDNHIAMWHTPGHMARDPPHCNMALDSGLQHCNTGSDTRDEDSRLRAIICSVTTSRFTGITPIFLNAIQMFSGVSVFKCASV
ncbi:hypothetical protein DFH08DRAFT_801561 [Mycena albidolilacea]|uniref:Uncharacterized protein n=1 Tax=Mycena albidolilacea TaxID=1033008 RepID=A0AAD7AIT7_9AGAR|nr:hypothetical protein DFH08DRAFT_801561 [Mycena albidolilacea]